MAQHQEKQPLQAQHQENQPPEQLHQYQRRSLPQHIRQSVRLLANPTRSVTSFWILSSWWTLRGVSTRHSISKGKTLSRDSPPFLMLEREVEQQWSSTATIRSWRLLLTSTITWITSCWQSTSCPTFRSERELTRRLLWPLEYYSRPGAVFHLNFVSLCRQD